MEYIGIIITGTGGAGKSAIAQELCQRHKIIKIVKAVTTRKLQPDDIPEEYQYITEEEFQKLDKEGKLLTWAKHGNYYYGVTNEALQNVIKNTMTPLLILTSKSVNKLQVVENQEPHRFLSIFLDASDDTLNERLMHRREHITGDARSEQNREDRKFAEKCIYSIVNENNISIQDVAQLIFYLWSYRNIGGMCPKKMLDLMIKCGMLLDNANLDNIQGASYDLVLGDEYFQCGKIKYLNKNNPFIVMAPGDYVLASSKETANLPKDIAGKFDLSVSLFCKGVILSNGPQIDPGFRGKLYSLLFNTSSEKVQLKREEHFATIEFIKLFEPTLAYAGKYQNKKSMDEYLPAIVEASAINKLMKDVDNLKREKWWIKILPLVLSICAIIATIILAVISYLAKK